MLLSGSVFEGGEGAGSQGLPDFSPYGLSKALTARMFAYYCQRAGVGLGKFVIPNPFGPLEEPRFTAYLMKTWLAGATAVCSSPAYVRDNIHVSRYWRRFMLGLPQNFQPPASRGLTLADMLKAKGHSRFAWRRKCALAWDSLAWLNSRSRSTSLSREFVSTRMYSILTPLAGMSQPPGMIWLATISATHA